MLFDMNNIAHSKLSLFFFFTVYMIYLFYSITFNLAVFLNLKNVSCSQHVVDSFFSI